MQHTVPYRLKLSGVDIGQIVVTFIQNITECLNLNFEKSGILFHIKYSLLYVRSILYMETFKNPIFFFPF